MLTIGNAKIKASELLPTFYEKQNYSPAWVGNKGITPQADVLIRIIREADKEGLRPGDYHIDQIEETVAEINQNQSDGKTSDPRVLATLDLLLTNAFLFYSSHLLNGRINPEAVDSAWVIGHRKKDIIDVLSTALIFNRVEETLKELAPQHPGYAKLREALTEYRKIAKNGGWPLVQNGIKIEKGLRNQRVELLRKRLSITGDLKDKASKDPVLFDDSMEQGVRNFQKRHGLKADGVAGQSTLAALNVPVEKRIRQIELNMERLRWLPQSLGSRYILVNVASYELYVVEKEETVMNMRVIVGKPYWDTPVFSANMTYLVLNPHWNIPQTIFIEETLPKILKNPDYLSKDRIKVLRSWSNKAAEIDPKTIDWSKVTEQNFKYRLRQEPGPGNPLGKVKFLFPNPHNVYLHDTSNKSLFNKAQRNFSHGCIRIEKPIDLAEYVLRSDSEWTPEKIRTTLKKRSTTNILLPEPIPVYLLYFTAWVDGEGLIEFRNDIYGRDDTLYQALGDELETI